jgi:hypothetical protein
MSNSNSNTPHNTNRASKLVYLINSFNKDYPGLARLGLSVNCTKTPRAPYLHVHLYSAKREVSLVDCELEGDYINIELIKTADPANRGKKYAEKLLAITLWCARYAGYRYSSAESMFMNPVKNIEFVRATSTMRVRNNKRPIPLSGGLFNKFGFTVQNKSKPNNVIEARHLNMNRGIPNGVRAVINSIS